MIISVYILQYYSRATVTKAQIPLWLHSYAWGLWQLTYTHCPGLKWPSIFNQKWQQMCLPRTENPSGYCHYLCKLLRRNEVLWPHAFSSHSWIGAASLPTLVLLWCRYKWNPSGSSSYTTMKEKNSSNFSVSLISCHEAAQTETSQVY